MVKMSSIDRLHIAVAVTAKLADGTPATLAGVDVAVLPRSTVPTASTAWTASSYSNGTATVLVAGPAADQTSAIALPRDGGDLWIRITDAPEVQAAFVDQIHLD